MFQDFSFCDDWQFPITISFSPISETGNGLCDFNWELEDTQGNTHTMGFSGCPIPKDTNSFFISSIEDLEEMF